MAIDRARPARRTSARNTASAVGERQMLPVQTKSTDALSFRGTALPLIDSIDVIPAKAVLLHEPAVAHHQRLAGERVGLERREEERDFGDVLHGREYAIDRLLEH